MTPKFFAALSAVTALVTMGLKMAAYWATNSVGLLSDAMESAINLSAALLAYTMLRWASLPPDEDHVFGHEKAEYLSSGVEGALILVAAGSIFYSAIGRLLQPQPLESFGVGLALSLAASSANLVMAWILRRASQQHRSVALEADAQHLLSDVWTTLAILLGVALVKFTGWLTLDPLVALLAAAWIGFTGLKILRVAAHGMLDASLPPESLQQIEQILAPYREQGLDFHALRTRQAGSSSFVQMHVLVPGDWSVLQGHDLLEEIESKIALALPGARLHTHLEPLEDPASFADVDLEFRRD